MPVIDRTWSVGFGLTREEPEHGGIIISEVVFTPARACPVLVNGHVIHVFSRFNVDGDQF